MELTPYSEKGLRTLSRFHAEEMLVEYACGTLDEKRRVALEEYLKTDEVLVEELAKVRKGLAYLNGLGGLRIPQDSLSKIRSSTGWLDRSVEALRIDEWHPGVRLGVESAAVVSIIFVIALVVPWSSLFQGIQNDNSGLTLAEIRRDFNKAQEVENVAGKPSMIDTVKGVVFDDEGVPLQEPAEQTNLADAKKPDTAAAGEVPRLPAADSKAATKADVKVDAKPTVVADKPAAPTAVAAAPVPAAPIAPTLPKKETAPAVQPVAKTKDAIGGGFLYRGTLKTTNVEATTPKLIEFLAQAGGRKAGQVPLGWKKEQGSYFHFTIPEAKYGELEAFFREYGTLVITKERHERVMPEGIIRLIIDVDEKEP